MAPCPLIIDCDPGQDDAVALLMAFASPEAFDLLGVTTVGGNVPIDRTSVNARAIRELADRPDVPVFAGCGKPLHRALDTAEAVHGVSGIDGANLPDPFWPLDERHGVDLLIETLSAAGERSVTLVTLGPLTNLATAFERAPKGQGGCARNRCHGWLDGEGQRYASCRVQHPHRSRGGGCGLSRRHSDHDDRIEPYPPGNRHAQAAGSDPGRWAVRRRTRWRACWSSTERARWG